MLQKGNRFCPFCFEDQFATVDTDDARPPVQRGRGLSVAAQAPAPVLIDFSDTAQPDAEEVIHIPGPTGATLEEADPGIGLVRPGAFGHMEVLVGGDTAQGAARLTTPRRVVIGIAGVLVLIALVLMGLGHFGDRNEAGGLPAFRADIERVQAALNRGDLGAAEPMLAALDAEHADDPVVQALKEAFDRRVQELAAKRGQLPEAVLKASTALRLNESTVPPAPAAASLPREAPVAVDAAPATSQGGAEDKECGQALAALALCQKK